MHNTAFAHKGLDFVYLPFQVHAADLATAMAAVRALNLVGLNVTVPHKVAVMDYCDELTNDATSIGAVNTIINRDGVLVGDNTDAQGFLGALDGVGRVEGMNVMVIGAGGAARAIAFGLTQRQPRRLTIVNRSLGRALQLVETLKPSGVFIDCIGLHDELFAERLRSSQLIVHATSCGMYPCCEESIIGDASLLPQDALVCDIVYNPLKTKLLSLAEQAGCKTLDGLGMLVGQGAIAFEAWTGVKAPVPLMDQVLRRKLSSCVSGKVSKKSQADE